MVSLLQNYPDMTRVEVVCILLLCYSRFLTVRQSEGFSFLLITAYTFNTELDVYIVPIQ